MESGQFDIYPEYTGTGWNAVLKRDTQYSENLFDELQRAYEDTYQFKWVGSMVSIIHMDWLYVRILLTNII